MESFADYDVCPVTKPRQTQSDRWKKRPCVLRYRAFADRCRELNMIVNDRGSHVIFNMPMPKSWSKKKKAEMDGEYHQQTPDADNLLKSVLDSLYKDDSHICDIRITKKWSYIGFIRIYF